MSESSRKKIRYVSLSYTGNASDPASQSVVWRWQRNIAGNGLLCVATGGGWYRRPVTSIIETAKPTATECIAAGESGAPHLGICVSRSGMSLNTLLTLIYNNA